MMELFIWYNTETKNCSMTLSSHNNEILKSDKSECFLFISKFILKSKSDYKKVLRMFIKLSRTYQLINQHNLD